METPRNYRKKPVVIEAIQWDGTERNANIILEWMDLPPNAAGYSGTLSEIIIATLEGMMSASPKDYIIRGVAGEFYPCKPDIFEASYENV